jgi:hypothetical protein
MAGDKVALTDGDTQAACGKFIFQSPEKVAQLFETADEPVLLTLADGGQVRCPDVIFDQRSGKAYLGGPGEMTVPSTAVAARGKPGGAAGSPPAGAAHNTITWQDSVDAVFVEEKVASGGGATKARQVLRKATFQGGVELTLGEGGDFVHCDHLEVALARDEQGRSYPTEAIARGSVYARQEGSDIRADVVMVGFAQFEEQGEDGRIRVAVRPASLEALCDVRVTDTTEGRDRVLVATGDHLESDLVTRTAVITGRPASVLRGTDKLVGPSISLYQEAVSPGQAEQRLAVKGRGELHFTTDRDLEGRQLERPRPVTVAWAREMEYRGARNTARFVGDVRFLSENEEAGNRERETVTCGTMRFMFREVAPTTRPAGEDRSSGDRPAPPGASQQARGPRRRLGLDVEPFSKRKVSLIVAEEDVKVLSEQRNEKTQLRRLQLSGPELVYDATVKQMVVLGSGKLLLEDYYQPDKKPREAAGGDRAVVESPSQTAFQWQKAMTLRQSEREVVLDGGVRMVHVSGNEVVHAEDLDTPMWWRDLSKGRRTDLRNCDVLIANFTQTAESKAKEATRAAADPSMGGLERFSAKGNKLLLEDGPRQVICRRLTYVRKDDMVTIEGYTRGAEPEANAIVITRDPKTGIEQIVRSPEFTWYRKNDYIEAKKVRASGGR